MTGLLEHIYIGHRARRRSYSLKLGRTVVSSVSIEAIATEEDFVAWAERNIDRILTAADRHINRLSSARRIWLELEPCDFMEESSEKQTANT